MLPAGFGSLYLKALERLDQPAEGCWRWQGPISDKGYGRVSSPGGNLYVHRVMFAFAYGWLPERPFELDHLCRVRDCGRPDHLESVTGAENKRRGTGSHREATCQAGHIWDEVGWYRNGDNGRKCKACHRVVSTASARRRATRSK